MADRIYYVISDDNCKFEGMTKEQIITAIQQAVSTGEIKDIDAGFVTKIKEQNAGKPLQFWVGTTAQFNAITEKAEDTFYILTDEDTQASLDEIAKQISEIIDGTIKVPKSAEADHATEAGQATEASRAVGLCPIGKVEDMITASSIDGGIIPAPNDGSYNSVDLGKNDRRFNNIYAYGTIYSSKIRIEGFNTINYPSERGTVKLDDGIYIFWFNSYVFLISIKNNGSYQDDYSTVCETNATAYKLVYSTDPLLTPFMVKKRTFGSNTYGSWVDDDSTYQIKYIRIM